MTDDFSVQQLLPPRSADEDAALAARLAFLEFGAADAQILRGVHEGLQGLQDDFAAAFYAHLSQVPELDRLIESHDRERLRRSQAAYFSSLTAGVYDAAYVRARRRVGLMHQRVGLAPEWYLGAYRKYLAELLPALGRLCGEQPERFQRACDALLKVLFFDIGLALDSYFEADRQQLEAARELSDQVIKIFQATSLSVGGEYLETLVRELSLVLGVSYAMVSVIDDESLGHAETLALVRQGQALPSFRYELEGSPCESVLEKGVCLFPSGVQALFPRDALLSQMGLECYAGIPLHARSGTPIGVLAVFGEQPLAEPQRAARMLEVFSLRAETELERMRIEALAGDSMAQFRSAFTQAGVGMLHVGADGTVMRANTLAARLLCADDGELVGRNLADYLPAAACFDAMAALTGATGVLNFEARPNASTEASRLLRVAVSAVRHGGTAPYFQFVLDDISARLRLETALRLHRRALDHSLSGVLIVDALLPGHPVVYVNQALADMTGYEAAEMLGRGAGFLQGDDGTATQDLRQAMQQGREARAVLRNRRKDGDAFWCDVRVSPVPDETGRIAHFVAIQTDITQARAAQDQLTFHATHDALTGLPNRTLLDDRLQRALLQAQRRGDLVALMFVDLDHFKVINDSFGHAAGDRLLVELARRLSQALRAEDTVARYGGDEFVLILGGLPDVEQVKHLSANLLKAAARPFEVEGLELMPTVSMGVALYPSDSTDGATLYRYADMALYRAKDLGRANVQFYSAELNARLQERVQLEGALRATLREQGIDVVYQPIVDLRSGRAVGIEALARWTHPALGVVAPDRFVRVAEESGQIAELGRLVLRRAFGDLRRWLDAGHTGLQLAVNVSARQFRESDLVEQVAHALSEARVPPEMICLEITESVMLQDTEVNEQTLHRLKALGLSLAMDDFGTGYSSLSYLRRLPFDKVKIDRSFIRDLAVDPGDAALARSIISMAHDLGIAVVAEGVETSEQCRFLREHACDLIQGYLFSKPLPAPDLARLVRDGRRLTL